MDRRHTHSVTLPGEQVLKYKPQETAYLESNIGVASQLDQDNNNNNNEKVIGEVMISQLTTSMFQVQIQSLFPIGYIQPQHLISMQEG